MKTHQQVNQEIKNELETKLKNLAEYRDQIKSILENPLNIKLTIGTKKDLEKTVEHIQEQISCLVDMQMMIARIESSNEN